MAGDCSGGDQADEKELSVQQIQQVTNKVYALFLRDLKIEQERRLLRTQSRRRW